MAKVLGESARYVSQEATKRFHSMWKVAVITMAIVGLVMGFTLRASFPWFTLPPLSGLLLSVLLLLLLWLVARFAFRRLDALQRERDNMRKGAAGENLVGLVLSNLPDEFCVVNDVPTPTGNLDHVVIGPTGVFVIETKNCRGIIAPDGKGELTLNGKPSEKPHVSRSVGRMMGTKERVQVLAPGVNPFFKAVIVFTSARVEAKFGTTGKAHCIQDDRLLDYILDTKPAQKLSAAQISVIAQAFAGLARMDEDFRTNAERVSSAQGSEISTCAPARRASNSPEEVRGLT